MKFYAHAYGDLNRHLPDVDDIFDADSLEDAYYKAWKKYAEYEEIYCEQADNDLLKEWEKMKK